MPCPTPRRVRRRARVPVMHGQAAVVRRCQAGLGSESRVCRCACSTLHSVRRCAAPGPCRICSRRAPHCSAWSSLIDNNVWWRGRRQQRATGAATHTFQGVCPVCLHCTALAQAQHAPTYHWCSWGSRAQERRRPAIVRGESVCEHMSYIVDL